MKAELLVLVVSLLCWTEAEDDCDQAGVNTSGDMVISPGEAFRLNCTFICLKNSHVAQLWKNNESLVNISSALPNVTLVLNVQSFTKAHTGQYQCKTYPPHTISPAFSIQIANNFTGKPPSLTISSPKCNCTQQTHNAAGLKGQLWFWVLLGKTTILLLSLASLAVKHKTE
ncbi:uncharacterized protein LOC143413474 [Maylandia zebra]|uniref:uncharacterized protein LOC143413474 n=1 Tax=Maylandia zebra TaxID=106582 RepID=UPI00403D2751